MARSWALYQWQELSALITFALLPNIQLVFGQVQSRTTFPAPVIVPPSESWFLTTLANMLPIH
jgi:hypothetical protein